MIKQLFISKITNNTMFYRRELMNLKNPEEYRLALHIFFHSMKPEPDLETKYFYYNEFGPKEEFEKAKKKLDEFFEYVEKRLKSLPEDADNVRIYPSCSDFPGGIFAVRKK